MCSTKRLATSRGVRQWDTIQVKMQFGLDESGNRLVDSLTVRSSFFFYPLLYRLTYNHTTDIFVAVARFYATDEYTLSFSDTPTQRVRNVGSTYDTEPNSPLVISPCTRTPNDYARALRVYCNDGHRLQHGESTCRPTGRYFHRYANDRRSHERGCRRRRRRASAGRCGRVA